MTFQPRESVQCPASELCNDCTGCVICNSPPRHICLECELCKSCIDKTVQNRINTPPGLTHGIGVFSPLTLVNGLVNAI